MIKQIILSNQLTTPQLVNTAQTLSTSLQAIQPNNSETIQVITFALVGTVVAGLAVYHYIRTQEKN